MWITNCRGFSLSAISVSVKPFGNPSMIRNSWSVFCCFFGCIISKDYNQFNRQQSKTQHTHEHTQTPSQFDPVERNLLHSGEKRGKVSNTSLKSAATSCRCGWIFSLALADICSSLRRVLNGLFDEAGLHVVRAWSSEFGLILTLSRSKGSEVLTQTQRWQRNHND